MVLGPLYACRHSTLLPSQSVARLPDSSRWQSVVVGGAFTCALTHGGEVYCWGDNDDGQLGLGDAFGRTRPQRVGDLHSVVALSAGAFHACALLGDGSVTCWGMDWVGSPNDDGRVRQFYPTHVAGLWDIVQVAVGFNHSCALRRDGRVLCWGQGWLGQLGNRPWPRRHGPTEVLGVSATRIGVGWYFSCALQRENRATCWGFGRPGHVTLSFPSAAAPASFTAGSDHLCMTVNTAVWCAARNHRLMRYDQARPAIEPRLLPDLHAERGVAIGSTELCAYGDEAAVRCHSRLGFPLPVRRPPGLLPPRNPKGGPWSWWRPTVRSMPSPIHVLALGSHGGCAILDDGGLYCWGDNEAGQVGDGTRKPRTTPIRVTLDGVASEP